MELGNPPKPRFQSRRCRASAALFGLALFSACQRAPSPVSPILESWVEKDGQRLDLPLTPAEGNSKIRGQKFQGVIDGTQGSLSLKWVLRTRPIQSSRDDRLWFDFENASMGFFHGHESIELRGSDRIEITLYDSRRHTFRVQTSCYDRPKAVRPKQDLPSGDPASQHPLEFWVLPKGGFAPRLALLPYGYRGAFVFSDHADQGSIERTRALGEAFLSRGLVFTKTVFNRAAPGYFAQAQNPVFSDLARRLQTSGIEIGLHSPSGQPDPPEAVESALKDFRQVFRGTTWIDHQPDTNCEAISNQGWNSTSKWGIAGALKRHGFRNLWAGEDEALGSSLALARPFWTSPALPGFVLFSSAWAYLGPEALSKRYSASRLSELARRRGIHIAHTYLDTFQSQGPHAPLSLLIPRATGGFETHPALSALLDELARSSRRKDLWVTTVERLAGVWEKLQKVRMEPAPEGRIRISAPEPLPGITLLTTAGTPLYRDDVEIPSQVGPDGLQEQWFDLRGETPLSFHKEDQPPW